MTQTVLFFVYSNKYICADRIDGARRYAEKVGWNIQVIEPSAEAGSPSCHDGRWAAFHAYILTRIRKAEMARRCMSTLILFL